MGFLDFLKGSMNCPVCGTPGARKAAGRVRCQNPICQNFDATMLAGSPGPTSGQPAQRAGGRRLRGNFSPTHPLTIRYRNFQGQEKTFTADAESAVRKRNHIVVRVVPTGEKISLARDRIQNLPEVEQFCSQRVDPEQDWPSPRERQVLNYHKKHGSTSPLYEKVRAKYPKW